MDHEGFSDSSVGVHWVEAYLTERINLTTHHVVVVAIVKECKRCILPNYNVATMQENREEIST